MEKTTKKRKTKKGLKKRIGLIAIGGLSLVLTICLSVGATLAWFAGSTHADKSLFMGGPVYVEMTGSDDTTWKGGSGNLDITSFERGMGTVQGENGILLPGQRFNIYSQARVFSTSATDSTTTKKTPNKSSGANTTNTSNEDGGQYTNNIGRKTTTTSSVLRARFSVSVEFDPSVGYNNFTDTDYAENYPSQSGEYKGAYANESGETVEPTVPAEGGTATRPALNWYEALGKESYKLDEETNKYPASSRRDAVAKSHTVFSSPEDTVGTPVQDYSDALSGAELTEVRKGKVKSIYSWKFVSKAVYEDASITAKSDQADGAKTTALAANFKYIQMGAPFDGKTEDKDNGISKAYGVWILDNAKLKESDSFYKARCNNYIQTYVEHYQSEYGDYVERNIGTGLKAIENALNKSFIDLVNDSSNAIIAGLLYGMKVDADTGIMSFNSKPADDPAAPDNANQKCSWLYIDPTIGNDTNTNELSTSTGGWWYLVECSDGAVGAYDIDGNLTTTDANAINTSVDNLDEGTKDSAGNTVQKNSIAADKTNATFTRTSAKETDSVRLKAKLFEIKPYKAVSNVSKNGTQTIQKFASYQFPFVNGSAVLYGDNITNIFANAKISVQISFQALQAFFPFTTSIDGLTYKNTLLGTAKALNIGNAIPIFNEAFDYYEDTSAGSITGL